MSGSRILLIALALLVVVGAGTVFWGIHKSSNESFATLDKSACELLTLNIAQATLGRAATETEDVPTAKNEETVNLKRSSCDYALPAENVQDTKTLSMELRAAKTGAGATVNASYFPPNKITDSQQVPGYGDEALWDSFSGRLRILKDGNFYQITMAKGLSGNTVALSEIQEVADMLGLKN